MALPRIPSVRPTSDARPGSDPNPTPDWPVQATDMIVKGVDTVRDRTTGPALQIARYVVYGSVAALLAVPLLVLLLVGVMRAFEGLLLLAGLQDPMWIVYVVFGVAFTAVGLYLWHKARQATPGPTAV
jgi:hypothetical protein